MGLDKALSNEFPVAIIDGNAFHFGKDPGFRWELYGYSDPQPDTWLIEHASIPKAYFSFDSEDEFDAKLMDLNSEDFIEATDITSLNSRSYNMIDALDFDMHPLDLQIQIQAIYESNLNQFLKKYHPNLLE